MYGAALLESLIEGIYKAAINSTAWITFLSSFAGALDCSHPSIYLADTSGREGSMEISLGMDDTRRRAYGEYYVHRNVWIQGARSLLHPGSVRSSDQVCSRPEFLRSEWYADFCRPLGWTRGIGATILQNGTTTANIGAFAGDSRPDFSQEDFVLVRELIPHLQRGLRMHRTLAESRAYGQALETVLHALPTAALLVGRDGTVLYMNAAAERLVTASDGLQVVSGHLSAVLPDDTASLCALIGGAAQISGPGRKSGGNLRVSRLSGRAPLELLFSPLPSRAEDDWLVRQRAVAAILITDPSATAPSADSTLIQEYGLTPSEGRVASAISRGLVGKQICSELDISYNTLKTHLKHLYAKTHVGHRSALIRLMAGRFRVSAPWMLGRDG